MRETTFTELRNHAKTFFDAVEDGETVRVYRNGRPVADIVPVRGAMPVWKKPPQTRLSLGSLNLCDEILADRACGESGEAAVQETVERRLEDSEGGPTEPPKCSHGVRRVTDGK